MDLQLKDVSISFRGIPVLQNIDLSIEKNELIGIFGPNGGGKTTLLKLLMGFVEPGRGDVRVFGERPEKVRHRIGYVPQIHRIDPDFPITVTELIAMGRLSKRPYFGGFHKLDLLCCEEWMERLDLTAHKNKTYGELSGGLAQRVLLARALIANPDLILLDEPTANIDAASLKIFLQTLESLKGNKTILLVTHDLKMIVPNVSRLLCVQGTISILEPSQICEHFALGLYHTVLAGRP